MKVIIIIPLLLILVRVRVWLISLLLWLFKRVFMSVFAFDCSVPELSVFKTLILTSVEDLPQSKLLNWMPGVMLPQQPALVCLSTLITCREGCTMKVRRLQRELVVWIIVIIMWCSDSIFKTNRY